MKQRRCAGVLTNGVTCPPESARTKNPQQRDLWICFWPKIPSPPFLLYGRLTLSIMAPSFDTLTEQDLHEEEEEEVDFSGACRDFRLRLPL